MRLQIQSPFAFVLMPFSSEFDAVYQRGIKRACDEAGVECERVDEQYFTQSIVERVYEQIARADLIIADMSGRNPNVYYEAGYARALKKPIIFLSQESDIPFDLKHYPHIHYGGDIRLLRSRLREYIVRSLSQSPTAHLSTFQLEFHIVNKHTAMCLDVARVEGG